MLIRRLIGRCADGMAPVSRKATGSCVSIPAGEVDREGFYAQQSRNERI